MKKPCQMCGVYRHRSDLAMHDDRWYCHPSLSVGDTCYTTATTTRCFDGWCTPEPN